MINYAMVAFIAGLLDCMSMSKYFYGLLRLDMEDRINMSGLRIECMKYVLLLILLIPFLNWQTAPLNVSHLARSQFPITGSKVAQSLSSREECEVADTLTFPSERNGEVIFYIKWKGDTSWLNVMSSQSSVDTAMLQKFCNDKKKRLTKIQLTAGKSREMTTALFIWCSSHT